MRPDSTPEPENRFNPDLCAVILAGGESRRMGRNKALVEVGGRPLITRVAEQASHLTNQVFLSANDATPYRFLGLPARHDLYPGQGPLCGLHAASKGSHRQPTLL